MSGEPVRETTAAERAAQEAVRGLARPRPSDGFRLRLRHEFVTGRFGRRVGVSRPAPWRRRSAWLVPAAAALATVLVVLNRGPDWRVVAVDGAGRVLVNGAGFTALDAEALSLRLRRGGHVRVEGAVTLDLVAPGVAAVALAPGTDVELSAAPGRWWGRGMRARLATGDGYFTTGRAFHGAHLDVSTPEVSARAVGTSFAVLCGERFTCVCVLEGRVRVGTAGMPAGRGLEVPQGMRRVLHADGRSELEPILDDSIHHLHAQREVVGDQLGR